MSPIQFSALKSLDPLQDEVKHGEDTDGQADKGEVEHDPSNADPART
jgi:hypothetical protein